MSSINVMQTIATEVSTSKAQEKAVIAALQRFSDLVSIPERQDPAPLVESTEKPKLRVDTDYLIFVLNGAGAKRPEELAMRSFVRHFAEKGSVTVVTVGRMGVEVEAAKMCKGLGLRHIEVGAVWQRPNVDGSTTRVPAARNVRNKVLRELAQESVAKGCKVAVARYGTEAYGDVIEELLVKAGAKARPGSKFFVPKVVTPVVAAAVQPVETVSLEA
jgi:hypothetical protein